MIQEYALEPALVARWHDRREFAFFDGRFGVRHRRLVSQYPKKWKLLVWREFRKSPAGQDQNAKGRMDALLEELCSQAIRRKTTFAELATWLEQAESEHSLRPFHAILATENPRAHEQVVVAGDLVEQGSPLWRVVEQGVVVRRAGELAKAVAPVVKLSRELAFVDPYFNPNSSRYQETFWAFLEEIRGGLFSAEEVSLEIHTTLKRFFANHEEPNAEEEERLFRRFQEDCQHAFRGLPPGFRIRVCVWNHRSAGEDADRMHNRYILTERMGLLFGIGLDEEPRTVNDSPPRATEDITILTDSQFDHRRLQYRAGSQAFDLVGEPFEIICGRDTTRR